MAIYLGTDKITVAGPSPDDGFMKTGQLIAQKSYTIKLSDTNYSSLTISTSSQNLTLPATTYSTSPTTSVTCFRLGENYDGTILDRNLYDYSIIGTLQVVYNYTANTATMDTLIHGKKTAGCRDIHFGKYYGVNSTTGGNATTLTKSSGYVTSVTQTLYRKVNGTYASASGYGISGSSITGSFSTSSGKDYLNLNTGTVSARANASYFELDAMNYIDTANTNLVFTWYVYQGTLGIYSRIYQEVYDFIKIV